MNTPEDFLKGINIKDRTIRVLTFNDKNYMLTDLMLDYAKVYAETLVKKCDLADVVGSEERAELVCEFCGTNKAEVCFKCHTNECVSAAGQN